MTRKEPARPEARSIYFAWHSGDAAWIRALDSDPLSGVWRRAIESHRVAGSEPGAVWSHGSIAHVSDGARALLQGSKTCSLQTALAGDPSEVFAQQAIEEQGKGGTIRV